MNNPKYRTYENPGEHIYGVYGPGGTLFCTATSVSDAAEIVKSLNAVAPEDPFDPLLPWKVEEFPDSYGVLDGAGIHVFSGNKKNKKSKDTANFISNSANLWDPKWTPTPENVAALPKAIREYMCAESYRLSLLRPGAPARPAVQMPFSGPRPVPYNLIRWLRPKDPRPKVKPGDLVVVEFSNGYHLFSVVEACNDERWAVCAADSYSHPSYTILDFVSKSPHLIRYAMLPR
jgi:hypothetical protein